MFFIHLGTRRVIVSGPTANPDAPWVTQQARNASGALADWDLPASHLLLDHDTKFSGLVRPPRWPLSQIVPLAASAPWW